jgi:Leucine-rich repeat (LRR) protein
LNLFVTHDYAPYVYLVCQWEGITCNGSSGVVTGVDVSGNRLEGTLPNSLGSISTLRDVYLSSNAYEGTLPQSIANLPNLVNLDVSNNKLDGKLPKTLKSTNLETFNLARNQFAGTLPASITDNMEKVKLFDIKYNRVGGTIPNLNGDMPSIEEMDLSNNLFVGK